MLVIRNSLFNKCIMPTESGGGKEVGGGDFYGLAVYSVKYKLL